MNKFILIIICIIMPITASAQLPSQLDPYIKRIQDKEIPSRHISILYAILSNTHEVCIHQQNGAKDNIVYVSKDGHKEAVFDKDGKLVQDGVNDGSYNYFHPSEQPLRHFTADISPWIMWGQSRTDNTTVKSRIYAYMGDLEGGIRRTLEQHTIPEVKLSDREQFQALAVFIRAIEEGKAESIFNLFDSKENVTDKQLIDALKCLNRGFEKVYTNS